MKAAPLTSPARIDARKALLIFLAVLALAIPQAALLPLLDRDEPRFAEASREMRQSGDFVVPTFNNAPRYAKPPLIYWCQVASYTVFGENAFAARLPSLLATAATACLLFTWGVRLGSEMIGLGAALGYAFCFQTIQQGRVATADALLIFFMTLTAFAGWQIIRPKAGTRCSPICYGVLTLGVAGGFLAKGPEALIPMLPLIWCARSAGRGVMAKVIASLLIGLALVLIWAIPAYIQSHGDYWKVGLGNDVYDRMVGGNFQGHGASTVGLYSISLFYYVLLFWISALPWSPLIVIQRRKLFGGWKPDPADTYLILNATLVFVIFTFMVTKLPHYTLPAFPFLALLFARRWNTSTANSKLPIKLGWISSVAFAVLASILIPIAIANHATSSPVGELVRKAGKDLTPLTEFAFVDFQEPNVIWEMRRVVTGYGHPIADIDFASYLSQPGPRAVVFSSTFMDKHQELFMGINPGKRIYEARGFNAAKGKFIDLYMVIKL